MTPLRRHALYRLAQTIPGGPPRDTWSLPEGEEVEPEQADALILGRIESWLADLGITVDEEGCLTEEVTGPRVVSQWGFPVSPTTPIYGVGSAGRPTFLAGHLDYRIAASAALVVRNLLDLQSGWTTSDQIRDSISRELPLLSMVGISWTDPVAGYRAALERAARAGLVYAPSGVFESAELLTGPPIRLLTAPVGARWAHWTPEDAVRLGYLRAMPGSDEARVYLHGFMPVGYRLEEWRAVCAPIPESYLIPLGESGWYGVRWPRVADPRTPGYLGHEDPAHANLDRLVRPSSEGLTALPPAVQPYQGLDRLPGRAALGYVE